MAVPLLSTKLYIPAPRPGVVPRPRLIHLLDAGRDGKLTLVSAGPGFGKTTLLSEWIAALGRPAAWISLDRSDNDPTHFLAYLIAALQKIHPEVGLDAQAWLGSSHLSRTRTAVGTLL